MNSEQLLDILKTKLGKRDVTLLAKDLVENDYPIKELIDLTLHKNQQIGFRAAWILEQIYSNFNSHFYPNTIYFLIQFSVQNNLSARRHYAKILAFLTHKKAPANYQQIFKAYDTATLVEINFNWIIDDEVPVAVKSQCLNVLANLSEQHQWIKEELLPTMDFLIDKESIAFYAKAKQIKQRFKRFSK